MKHNVAIEINPKWDASDFARAKEMLIHKLAHQHDFDVDAVRRGAVFTEIEYSFEKLFICTFEPRTDVQIVWTRDELV